MILAMGTNFICISVSNILTTVVTPNDSDHTASGRPLDFIEDFIKSQVLPMYANTHTTSSITGLQSTLFRTEARQIIRNAIRASENDAVIFSGSGATGAMQLLISAMALKTPPIVFIGPYEHHSAELPWINARRTLFAFVKRQMDSLIMSI